MVEILVREFDAERDSHAVEEMERRCEVGPSGKPSIFTDFMGDAICRIRHSPVYLMLVAEYEGEKGIVGVIRGCIKTVTRGRKPFTDFPIYTKVAYILGLRVSPTHRRLGIGTKLVEKLEEWCRQKGAEYAYMATERGNQASINLFTLKCAYIRFRTPTILVQPVHVHRKPIGSSHAVIRLAAPLAESIYRRLFSAAEFFPKDIDAILSNQLNLGTFMALPKKHLPVWDPQASRLPPSFAVMSVWNCKDVFKLQVKGVSPLTRAWCAGSRVLDGFMPWLQIPSIPDVFQPFGVYLLYGLYMEGKGGMGLMKALCRFAHNMGRDDVGCGAIVAEVGRRDPVQEAVPHWQRFSCAEDVWCMKRLVGEEYCDGGEGGPPDWVQSQPSSPVLFVDPREF
ncbi:probable N-acetyltransferase HLS1 [Magnolia sinica]|uniref:probable N-acetyltransferase HLS1 n=1 Tax=Magnolia sinica TaxID=86752 RepID=UPI0026581007|nr:probable N-acetyltransferase HLS1 [Magnolia sinica]